MTTALFFLHPKGNDQSDGAKPGRQGQGAWATMAGARDRLRELRAAGKLTGSATVLLADGVYPLQEPVGFGPQDSHTTYAAAPGAKPVMDGGRVLCGWTQGRHGEQRAWTLDLPEVASGHLYFRSLFVAGERRPRARTPKFSPDLDGVKKTFRIGAMRFPEKRKLFAGDHMFKPAQGDMQPWASLHDAEIVLLHYWVETRLPAPRLDPVTGWVTCSRRSVFNLYESSGPKLARYYIDNLFEALTEPGEWYLDRTTGRLTYLPMPGETLANTRVTIPVVTQFVNVAGQAFNRCKEVIDPMDMRPVESLAFEGLTFRHTGFRNQRKGFLHEHPGGTQWQSWTSLSSGSSWQTALSLHRADKFRGCAHW